MLEKTPKNEDYCRLYSRVAWKRHSEFRINFTRLRCKQWSCDYCAKKNAAIWRMHLLKRLPQVSNEWWLVTLTSHSKARSQAQSLSKLRQALGVLIKRMNRVFGPIEYVRVYERHPTSEAVHMHAIMTGLSAWVVNGHSVKHQPVSIGVDIRPWRDGCWSVKTWLKNVCHDLKIGFIADVQRIAGEVYKAVNYVCKYLVKDLQSFSVKGLRRVQTSRKIGSASEGRDKGWSVGSFYARESLKEGEQLFDLNKGEAIPDWYWGKHSFYPYED